MTSFNGGNNLDMIPDSVVLLGTFRAFSNTSFYQLLERIEQVRDCLIFMLLERIELLVPLLLSFFEFGFLILRISIPIMF